MTVEPTEASTLRLGPDRSGCYGRRVGAQYLQPAIILALTRINCSKWQERWKAEVEIPSGDQGNAYGARRKEDGQVAFLKSTRVKDDPQRRARFFREASA